MKKYITPELKEEVIELDDIIAKSGDVGNSLAGETEVSLFPESNKIA